MLYTRLVRYRALYAIDAPCPSLHHIPFSCSFFCLLFSYSLRVHCLVYLAHPVIWLACFASRHPLPRRGVYLPSPLYPPRRFQLPFLSRHTSPCRPHQSRLVQSRTAAASSARKTPTRVSRRPTQANRISRSPQPRSNGPYSRPHRPRSFCPRPSLLAKNGQGIRWTRPT